MPDVEYLKRLALMGAVNKSIKISSNELQKYIGRSSKTVARKLKRLEEEGLIQREIVAGGQMVILTKEGLGTLRREYSEYSQIFSPKLITIEIEGSVFSGLGEGQYYVNIPGYRKQFEEKLGFVPFPGTLNLRLVKGSSKIRDELNKIPAIKISGFYDGERTFGEGRCYYAKVGNIDAAIVIPERTHYPEDLIEIIAPVKLREALDLKDGDRILVSIGKDSSGG